MKKFLLLVLAVGIGVSAMSQAYKLKTEPTHFKYSEKAAIGVEPVKDHSIIKSNVITKPIIPASDRDVDIVNIISIGTSANAYGYGYNGGQKSLVWVEPELNIVTNFHRMGGNLDIGGYSGDLGYDISFDGGLTWTNQVECYVATDNGGGEYYYDAARYPNHGIYNPTNNVDDAYLVFFAPNLDGSNSDGTTGWGGYSFGTSYLSDPSVTTKNLKATHGDYLQYIPDAYDLTSLGMSIVVDPNQDRSVANAVTYQDNLIINRGFWDDDAQDFVYTESLLDFEIWNYFSLPWHTEVAFAPDGMTGYIVCLANDGETWAVSGMPSIYPMVSKTTDGGETWSEPFAIQIDGPNGIGGIVNHLLTDEQIAELYEAPVPARDEIPYTYTGDFNMAVTADGNLHIAGLVAPAGTGEDGSISFYVTNYMADIVDIFTTDGGITWFAEEMGSVLTWQGSFGDLDEANRTQITTNPTGDKVFISWLDTVLEEEEDNVKPNIFCRGFEPATYMKTSYNGNDEPTYVTRFSEAMNAAFFFAAPKTCFEDGGTYTIPFTYEDMTPTDPAAPVQFKYITNFSFSDEDFTVQGVNDPIENTNNINSVSQNYPNPFNNETYVIVSLSEGINLSLEVYTLTGQMVSAKNYGYMVKGSHTLTINGADLTSGVYFYTVTAGENKVTRKMIVK